MANILSSVEIEDADEVARRLIEKFGSIRNLISASETGLAQICNDSGKVAAILKASRSLDQYGLREMLTSHSRGTAKRELYQYLISRLALKTNESALVLFLNEKNAIISESMYTDFKRHKVKLPVKEIISKSIDFSAQSVIISHNHPSGNYIHNPVDCKVTLDLDFILRSIEVDLVDHLIVCGNQVVSLKDKVS